MPPELFEPPDVARLACLKGVPLTPARVRSLADAGVIPVAGITPRGTRLFSPAAVERFLVDRVGRARVAAEEPTGPPTSESS
jgi:hypothetical protein